jgi:SAM-dependent methyltransferase
VPVIVPDLRRILSERGLELLLREDVDPSLESLFGDAIGPDSWLDAVRMMQSTYGWDSYADLDPDEPAPAADGPTPGAAGRCLARLMEIAHARRDRRRILDLGCAAGRTSFALADAHAGALVLGVDLQLGLLRLAAKAGHGAVSYPRRRIGLVYDRRRFAVDFHGAERVDFWACDALALPFAQETADLCVGLNLLDCVPDPRRLLESLAAVTAPDGDILLATPYDWSTRATPPQAWLGGHSQRAPHAGAAEAFLYALLDPVQPGLALSGLVLRAEEAAVPWQTRLHERSTVSYRSHLIALSRAKV